MLVDEPVPGKDITRQETSRATQDNLANQNEPSSLMPKLTAKEALSSYINAWHFFDESLKPYVQVNNQVRVENDG